jgi:hypothetical protein
MEEPMRNLLKETVEAMLVNPVVTDEGAALAVMGVIYCAVYHGNPETEVCRMVYSAMNHLDPNPEPEEEVQ